MLGPRLAGPPSRSRGVARPTACRPARATAGGRLYVGVSANTGRRPRSVSAPLPRFWQHTTDIFGRCASRRTLHKTARFSGVHGGDLVLWVCLRGDATAMQAVERRLIRMLAPSANCTMAKRSGFHAGPEGGASRRRRPPPAARGEPATAPLDAIAAGLPGLTSAFRAAAAAKDDLVARRAQRELHTKDAYWAERRRVLGGDHGPVTLYSPHSFDFGVGAACSRDTPFLWHLFLRTHGRAGLYRFAFAVLRMRRPGRRHLGTRRSKFASRAWGELPWYLPPLCHPADAPTALVRALVGRLVATLSRGCPWRRAWLRERLRLAPVPPPTLLRTRLTMVRACRGLRRAEVLAMPAHEQEAAAQGRDMRRCKTYWRVPEWRDQDCIVQDVAESTARWIDAALDIPAVERQRLHLATALALAWPSPTPPVPPPSHLYVAHVAGLPAAFPHQTLVLEDKDRSACWLQDTSAY